MDRIECSRVWRQALFQPALHKHLKLLLRFALSSEPRTADLPTADLLAEGLGGGREYPGDPEWLGQVA